MFMKLSAIIANTFTETIRQPIYNILLWVAIGLLLLNPALAAFSLQSGKDNKILIDVGLATMLLYGLLISAFAASAVITREIESFTVLTVISKPVSRPLFLLGKYFGVTSAVLVGYFVLSIVFLMTVRHGVMETVSDKYDLPVLILSGIALLLSLSIAGFGNYVYGWHFPTTLLAGVVGFGALAFIAALFFDKTWTPQSPLKDFGNMQIISALILVFCSVMILCSFAVSLATRFSQVMTLMLCAGIFLLGLLSDYYFGQRVDQDVAYQFAYGIVPNIQFFWVGDALTQDLHIPAEHVFGVCVYAGLYSLAVLALGVALFQQREVG